MGMIVQHNMNAINAYNKLNANVAGLKKASEKLSSGYRINRAGDDAAGLAISEKMRSQIRGLNQAVRNSQDGINMIQTFEGAAQETHTILQRMKELAVESANGTYDNSTDRAAIQLEFEQLNDELNQIADTDFNGTIVLNGGQMADGLLASNGPDANGEFDYRNKADQVAAAKQAIQDQIDALKASMPEDIGANADKWKTVDDSKYDAAAAAKFWEDLGLDSDTVKDLDITFTWDGNAWTATSAKTYDGDGLDTSDSDVAMDDDKKGNEVDIQAILDKVNAALATINPHADANGEGGFTVSTSDGTVIANAIFDATDIKVGDTVTLNFTNPNGKSIAPKNAGLTDDTMDQLTGKLTYDPNNVGVKINGTTGISDDQMSELLASIFEDLENQTFSLTFNTAAVPGTTGLTPTLGAAQVTLGGQTFNVAWDATNKSITLKNAAAITLGDGTTVAANSTLFEITLGDIIQDPTYTDAGTVQVDLQLKFSTYNFGGSEKPDVTMTAGEPNTEAIDAKIAELQAQMDAMGVTKPDAFDNSLARLTYANHIILQTGARTKDAVDFTFSYNRDGSADMGELVANLNLSARTGGLETENLSLATQEDANYAIDQIDKAINKTSMVRATFGAIQNRLEHKINNLTTTSENLTEAESSIRDTDMAQEMMNYTKYNILQQAAQSMLAQANQQPQSILQLLG